MGHRSSIMKFCLLFFITVAFIVLPGLSTHSVTTADVSYVLAEEVEEESAEEVLEDENELTEESTDSDEKVDSQTNKEPTDAKKESEKKEAVKKDKEQDAKEDKEKKEQPKVEENLQDKPVENNQLQTNEETKPDIDWGAEHFELINYPDPVRAEDHPAFITTKETFIISNSDFFVDDSLFIQGTKAHPEYGITGIYIDNYAYAYLGGGITAVKEIHIDNHSMVCAEASIAAQTGDIYIENGSTLYLRGSLNAGQANIIIDRGAKVVMEDSGEYSAGGYIEGEENIIMEDDETFKESMDNNCFYKPEEVPDDRDLNALKTAKDSVYPGEEFEYTITVLNEKKEESIEDITVTDELEEELTFISESDDVEVTFKNSDASEGRVESGIKDGKLTVEIDELAAGDIAYITFRVKVDEELSEEITSIDNEAEVSYPGIDEALKPRRTIEVIPYSEFTVTKLVDKAVVDPGEELTYTIEITNTEKNGKAIEKLLVEDELPKGVTYVAGSLDVSDANADITFSEGKEGNISGDISNLPGNEKVTITFKVRVDKEASEPIKNIVTVKKPNLEDERQAEANTIIRPPADFEVTKTVDKEFARISEIVEYTIEVTNTSTLSQTLKNLEIEDDIPGELWNITLIEKDEGINIDRIDQEKIEATISELEAGQKAVLTFKASVLNEPDDKIKNIVKVTNPDERDNPKKASAETEVVTGTIMEKRIENKKIPYHIKSIDDEFTWKIDLNFNESPFESGTNKVILSDKIHELLMIEEIRFFDKGNKENNIVTISSVFEDTEESVEFDHDKKEIGVLKIENLNKVLFESGDEQLEHLKNKNYVLEIDTKLKDDSLNSEQLVKLQEVLEKGIPNVGKLTTIFDDEPEVEEKTNEVIAKLPTSSLLITKIDGDTNENLYGAEFELRKCNGSSTDNCEVVDSGRTLTNGKVSFSDVPLGIYYLYETKAPVLPDEGYNLLTKPIKVEINEIGQVKEIEVKNYKTGWKLPDSGGIGTVLFYGVGAALMIGALYFIFRKRKEE